LQPHWTPEVVFLQPFQTRVSFSHISVKKELGEYSSSFFLKLIFGENQKRDFNLSEIVVKSVFQGGDMMFGLFGQIR